MIIDRRKLACAVVAGGIAGVLSGYAARRQGEQRAIRDNDGAGVGTDAVGASIGGPFQLTTYDGQPFGWADLDGRASLVVFLLREAPELVLQTAAQIVSALPAAGRNATLDPRVPRLIAISLDGKPGARVAEALARAASGGDGQHHLPAVLLYGDRQQTRRAAQSFRLISSTATDKDPVDAVAGGHILFLLDSRRNYISHLRLPADSAALAHLLRLVL
ncbi:MAG: SCO family protein [Hyphomicrobiaceae bacterium]|nr:SCO family protein [Hyphomicrobiaceae bacterium]